MKSAVIVFPASNCDRDAAVALEAMTGKKPHMVWHGDSEMPDVDLIVLPGGFSYGDYLRCGAMASQSRDHARGEGARPTRACAVLGICNGFQVLTEAHLLPGALMRNADLKFVCRPVALEVDETQIAFTRKYSKGEQRVVSRWRMATAIISPTTKRSTGWKAKAASCSAMPRATTRTARRATSPASSTRSATCWA